MIGECDGLGKKSRVSAMPSSVKTRLELTKL